MFFSSFVPVPEVLVRVPGREYPAELLELGLFLLQFDESANITREQVWSKERHGNVTRTWGILHQAS